MAEQEKQTFWEFIWTWLTRSRYSFLYLALYIVALYVILNKVIFPFAVAVLSTEPFLGKPEESGSPEMVHNERTELAFLQCKRFVSEELDKEPRALTFPEKYKSWDIGFGRFLISGEVTVAEEGGKTYAYVCRVKFEGEDMTNPDEWELQGLAINEKGTPPG